MGHLHHMIVSITQSCRNCSFSRQPFGRRDTPKSASFAEQLSELANWSLRDTHRGHAARLWRGLRVSFARHDAPPQALRLKGRGGSAVRNRAFGDQPSRREAIVSGSM